MENTDENHAVYLLAVWEENKTEYETEDKSKSENEWQIYHEQEQDTARAVTQRAILKEISPFN